MTGDAKRRQRIGLVEPRLAKPNKRREPKGSIAITPEARARMTHDDRLLYDAMCSAGETPLTARKYTAIALRGEARNYVEAGGDAETIIGHALERASMRYVRELLEEMSSEFDPSTKEGDFARSSIVLACGMIDALIRGQDAHIARRTGYTEIAG